MLFFFPRGVLDETLNLIESVSEGFPSYFFYDWKFKMAAMPIYGKTIQITSFPEPLGRLG